MQAPRPLKTAQNIPAEALERILAHLPTNQERCGAACYMRSVVNGVDTMQTGNREAAEVGAAMHI